MKRKDFGDNDDSQTKRIKSTKFTYEKLVSMLGDRDPDLREMAIRDLEQGLISNDTKLSDKEEQTLSLSLAEMVTKDQTLKVLAGHGLVELLTRSNNVDNITNIIGKLIENLRAHHEEDVKTIREVSTNGIKGLICGIKIPLFDLQLIYKPLLEEKKSKTAELAEYIFDILETLLVQWGSFLQSGSAGTKATEVYESILTLALSYIKSKHFNIQAKAIGCLGNLGAYLTHDGYVKLIKTLIKNLEREAAQADFHSDRMTLFSLSTMCRVSGNRISDFLSELVPLVGYYVTTEDYPSEAEQVKVWEEALNTFGSMVTHCGFKMRPFYSTVSDYALQYVTYDPTVFDDGNERSEEEKEEEFEFDDEADGDETESWRVRKACVRCLYEIGAKYANDEPESVAVNFIKFYDQIESYLVRRFTDTQENVKVEAIKTLEAFVGVMKKAKEGKDKLLEGLPTVITALAKQFKSKGDKAQVEAYCLIEELSGILLGYLDPFVGKLIPAFLLSFKNKSDNLKVAAFKAIKTLIINSTDLTVFNANAINLLTGATAATGSPNYKVTSFSLSALSQLCRLTVPSDFNFDILLNSLTSFLNQDNAALEVKEAALSLLGTLLAEQGDKIESKQETLLKLLGDKLTHATTSVSSAKALGLVCSSKRTRLDANLSQYLMKSLLASLLLLNRQVRQASLEVMASFILNTKVTLSDVQSVADYITDDLVVASLALKTVQSAVTVAPGLAGLALDLVVPKCVKLLNGEALKGSVVNVMGTTLKVIVEAKKDKLETVVHTLTETSNNEAVAIILSHVLLVGTEVVLGSYVKKFVAQAKGGSALATLALGEIGYRVNLGDSLKEVLNALLGCMNGSALSSSGGLSLKSVRFCAAKSLGNVATKNEEVLNIFNKELEKNPQHILLSIRQVIDKYPPENLHKISDRLLKLILDASDNESLRDAVSDCLSGLLLSVHAQVIDLLIKAKSAPSKHTRCAVVKAISLAVNQAQDLSMFVGALHYFIDCISDPEVEVRTAALGLLHTCIQKSAPLIVGEMIGKCFPLLCVEAKPRPELVSTVVIGNHTFTTDLGIASRRITFEILSAFVQSTHIYLTPKHLLDLLCCVGNATSVSEEMEIQLITHKIAIKFANEHPEIFLRNLSFFKLETVFLKVLPPAAIDVDKKQNAEIVSSALLVVQTMESMLYESKHLSKHHFLEVLDTLITVCFGGLDVKALYTNILGFLDSEFRAKAVLSLINLWKLAEKKLTVEGHKEIADKLISNTPILISSFVKKLPPQSIEQQFISLVESVSTKFGKFIKASDLPQEFKSYFSQPITVSSSRMSTSSPARKK